MIWTPKKIYTGLSVLGAALFVIVTLPGEYSAVERIGGAAWVFMLLMIVLIPAVTGRQKNKRNEKLGSGH